MGDEKQKKEKQVAVIEGKFSMEPRNLTEAIEFSKLLAASGVVPREYVGKPGDILVTIQMGLEVGLKPLQALQCIACINGRPTIWGDGALALVKNSKDFEYCDERGADASLKAGEGSCAIKRKDEPIIVRTFSLDDANRAGLIARSKGERGSGPWITYPGRMLQMRARSWALRDGFADVLKGLSIREEVEDFQPLPEKDNVGQQYTEPRRLSEVKKAEAEAQVTAHSAICKLEADFLVPVEAAERAVKSKMGVYQAERERMARAEQLRLEAEARKQEEDLRLIDNGAKTHARQEDSPPQAPQTQVPPPTARPEKAVKTWEGGVKEVRKKYDDGAMLYIIIGSDDSRFTTFSKTFAEIAKSANEKEAILTIQHEPGDGESRKIIVLGVGKAEVGA